MLVRAPPPQSGVSTNFTTWAKKPIEITKLKYVAKLINFPKLNIPFFILTIYINNTIFAKK